MTPPSRIPSEAEVVVVGAGFAGASVAAALTHAGVTQGLILEQEPQPGSHASGRNAAMARQLEPNPLLLRLAVAGVQRLRAKRVEGRPALRESGGIYLLHGQPDRPAAWLAQLQPYGVPAELLAAGDARSRFPFLSRFEFDCAVFMPTDGVVDIHALLTDLLGEAKRGGFAVVTECPCESLIFDGPRVRGVRTPCGMVRACVVVDASGAWAGRLGRARPLPLKCLRRHLFVSGSAEFLPRDAPLVWDLDAGYYVRPEAPGLLLCPCDESEQPPGTPAVDPKAQELLVDKLLRHAPGLAEITLQRSWAGLRTFAPDRLPIIGWDPGLEGLFHVSALGGFGVTTSLAVGDLAATLIRGGKVEWFDADAVSAGRGALG
jgi:D-arginine dehydrogenase